MKEFLEGFLDRLETKTEPNDGEYLSDDGLLYCEKMPYAGPVQEDVPGKDAHAALYMQV